MDASFEWRSSYESITLSKEEEGVSLPLDLLAHLLQFLLPSDVFSCLSVSSTWFCAINTKAFLLSYKPTIEEHFKIALLGEPSIRWLCSESTFQQRDKMAKKVNIYNFCENDTEISHLRKICFDHIRYSSSKCGWRKEYFIRLLYNKIHYHLHFRIVTHPKELRFDAHPGSSLLLLPPQPSTKFLERTTRHVLREYRYIGVKEEISIVNLDISTSLMRSSFNVEWNDFTVVLDEESSECESQSGTETTMATTTTNATTTTTTTTTTATTTMIAENLEAAEAQDTQNEQQLDDYGNPIVPFVLPPPLPSLPPPLATVHMMVNTDEGISDYSLQNFFQFLVDLTTFKEQARSPESFQIETKRIIQRQDRLVDLLMTLESILFGCLGNFLYPLCILIPACFFFDVIQGTYRSECWFPLSLLLGIFRFVDSVVVVLVFTLFGVWGCLVGTSVYSYGIVVGIKQLLPTSKPTNSLFAETDWQYI